MATRLLDHFTDTNAVALDAHTMDTGSGWTVHEGTLDIQTNRAQSEASAGNRATADAGVADGVVKVTAQINNSDFTYGLVVRQSTSNNFWLCTNEGGTQIIASVVNGSKSDLATQAVARADDTDYVHKVTLNGNTITYQIDANTALSVTSSFNNTATRHGIMGYVGASSIHARFEDFSVEDLPPSGVTVAPGAASAGATGIVPSVALGALALQTAAATSHLATANPLPILGPVSAAPLAAFASARSSAPTVTLGALLVAPPYAASSAWSLAPVVLVGSSFILSPTAALSGSGASAPVLILGPVGAAPLAAFASAVTRVTMVGAPSANRRAQFLVARRRYIPRARIHWPG